MILSGCGKETVHTAAPIVTSTTPANGATAVPVNQVVSATFSQAMNAATIIGANFTLSGPGGTAVAGTVAYTASGSIATFSPNAPLAYNTLYTATITTGVANTIGNQSAAPFVWSFTTAVQPTVVSTVPANGATAVPTTQVLSATFSKAINPASITSSTFKLTSSSGSVAGTISAAGSVATFTPSSRLAYNTVYTATITTGATDAAGYPLAANYVWSFTTAIQPTVIATTPASGATAVPPAQALSATFSAPMNPATITSSTFTLTSAGGSVAGTVSAAGSLATFTPSARLAYNTVYTATITTGAADAAGDPLAANYVWSFTTAAQPTVTSTAPLNGATGVPLNQVLSATFSKAMNCSTLSSPASAFTLSTPGVPSVAGTVACSGSTATFTPAANLATNTVYTATITTAATDTIGYPLAANYVWTFKTAPAATPPAVIATVPANGAASVPLNQALAVTFSVAMNPATINSGSFTLTATGGAAVTGVVTYVAAGSIATFTPAANLAPNTLYTATITTAATNTAGTPLAANYVWTFTTAAATNTTRPTVIATIPLNGATNVATNQALTATFSEAMNPATITPLTFTLAGPGATTVSGIVTYAGIGNTATFTPAANLTASTLYTATITTGATDLSGNTLAANYVWTFTTGAAPDTTQPVIVATVPANAATGVALGQAVSATFSEAMDPLTITTGTFGLTTVGGTPVPSAVSYNAVSFIATLTPTNPLTSGTAYNATVTTGATDLAGNALGAGSVPNPWTFTTGTTVVPLSPPALGTAALFGGFGGAAGLTNAGTQTVINGNIGTTGVSTLITGFHDSVTCTYTETTLNMGMVNGSIDTAPPPPTVGCPNEGTAVTQAIAAQAAGDALNAYNALVAYPGGLDVSTCPGCGGGSAGELGNRTLSPGVYKSAAATYSITQGDLTLDAQGNPNAVWIFQMSTSLTVGTPSAHRSVLLVNGAQAKNVFWQVGSAATINGILGGGTMSGTVIAQAGISVSTIGVAAVTTVNGRLLVLTGPLTVDNTVVNTPAP